MPEPGQPCLCDESNYEKALARVMEQLANNTTGKVISISQNDNHNYCKCNQCKAKEAELGTKADILLSFVNRIAEEVAKKYPDVKIHTLAYFFTVKILELPDEAGSREETLCRQLKEASRFAGDGARFDQNERFSGFVLLVNGIRIFCKGGNWVPCEPFPSAERDDKITSILELAQKANMNMVRVWGGGLFEKDHFYNECDRLGLLVTQDFMMACGDYPEDDDRFCDEIRKEAEQAVVRLRNHPSLVWWTGDNENGTFAYEDRKGYVSRKVSMSILAPVVMALDPYRDFLLSSPYGGVPFGSVTKGTTHNTNYMVPMFGTFESSDLSDYRGVLEGFLCRFCAEHPTMGMPTLFGMKRFLGTENIFEEDDDILRFHTKNNPGFVGNELFDYINLFAEKILGNYVNPLDRRLKQQYIQYEWIRITGEYFRRHAWFTSGLIYWMLNDCWPAAGWSLIDYYNIPKLGYYAATKTNRSVMVSIAEDRQLRCAARAKLLDPVTKLALGNCQTSQAMGLAYGLFEEDEKQKAFAHLLRLIDERDGHMDVGVLGMRVIFDILADFGYADLAYHMITRTDYPAYGEWVARGETTLREMFTPEPQDSLNHHFWGDISRFFIERVVGIRYYHGAFADRIVIAPHSTAYRPFCTLISSAACEAAIFPSGADIAANTFF